MTASAAEDILKEVQEVKGVKILAAYKPELDALALRQMGVQLKDKLGEMCGLLAGGTQKAVICGHGHRWSGSKRSPCR